MITKKLIINGVEYSVSATTLRGLEEAEQYLTKSLANHKPTSEELEEQLNRDFDELLQKIDSGELEIPSVDAIEKLEESEPVKPKRTRKKKD